MGYIKEKEEKRLAGLSGQNPGTELELTENRQNLGNASTLAAPAIPGEYNQYCTIKEKIN